MSKSLKAERVEIALREVISELDYDIHKDIECGEDTEEDTYPYWVDRFILAYERSI